MKLIMIQIQKLGNGNTINGSTKMPPQRLVAESWLR